mgnify:CR=1 FL=1
MKKAIIDIDGVLNNYPQTLIDYCNYSLKTNFKTLHEIKSALSFIDYRKMKENYINSEFKNDANVKENAVILLNLLKQTGYLIYIITSRDLFKNNQLERTINWLKKNRLIYDYIYCSAKKDFTIFEKFGHVDLVVEDNVDNLNNIKRINGDALYINVINSENIDYEFNGIRVNSLIEIFKYIK